MNWKPPGVFVLWKQVQPLQRSDREGFNGVLPMQACSCAPDKVLSVQLTRPALVPRHIAQVIAFIIVQPRQVFQEAIRGRGIPEEEGQQRLSLARETIQSLAASSLGFI